MKDLSNPYNRLARIFDSIEGLIQVKSGNGRRIRIREIAEVAQIPMEVFRADLCKILDVRIYDYDLIINGEYVSDLYEESARGKIRRRNDFLSGKLDDAELEVCMTDSMIICPLTGEESSIMDQMLHETYGKKNPSPFLVKDSYHFTFRDEKKINDTLYNIRYAIINTKEIRIRYYGEEISVKPVRLFYDSTENLYAVICLHGAGLKAYRIDKIQYLRDEKKYCLPKDLTERLSVVPNVWGLDFSAQPLNVRIRIYSSHSRGNVGKNIKKDLQRRINGRLYEKDGCLIYEDVVMGKEAFLRWVFSYGSSIVVEKPSSLRKQIKCILEKELAALG